jgi:hypothetical protein
MTKEKNSERSGLSTSHKATPSYEMRCDILYRARVPRSTGIMKQLALIGGEMSSYTIEGTLASDAVDSEKWTEPPHKVLANLPVLPPTGELQQHDGITPIDPKAAETFIRNYGVLDFITDDAPILDSKNPDSGIAEAGSHFAVKSSALQMAQNVLRKAWEGDPDALVNIRKDAVEDLVLELGGFPGPAGNGRLELRAANLWNFICVLFLRDYVAGKIGKCINPSCPVPYFLKRRRTQKACDLCLEWAQKKYALDWWNQHGRESAKERYKSQKRTRR